MAGIPANWYEFDASLPEVRSAPVPSQANYSPRNIAPLIEMFAGMLGQDKKNVIFRYENNTPNNPSDDIFVSHPNDRSYYSDWLSQSRTKSNELLRYEEAAKKSKILAEYERNSPANISYFQRIT